ncbi:MAG: type IV pilin protein [Massilia sp.]
MQRRAGFTLIEVMIVLCIVGILAAVAYPSYTSYITRTRRVEGQIALIEIMQQQERFYTLHNSYSAFSAESTDPEERRFKWYSGSAATASAYELRAAPCAGHTLTECVQLRAIPGSGRVDARFRDGECGELTLNSAGERAASGVAARCWP